MERILIWRRYLLVFLAASLCCTVVLKIGEIQYLECVFALDFLLLCGIFLSGDFKVKVFRPFLKIGEGYAIFLGLAFLLSLFALQQEFSSPVGASILKQPVVVTLARMAELFLDAFYMLVLATFFREDDRLCEFGAKIYYWTGIAGCFYSFVTYPLNVFAHAQLGTYTSLHRFRGFNNEGGGFGVYLVSVMLVVVVMYRRSWLTRGQFGWGMAILLVGLGGSLSKSAFFALAILGTIGLLWFLRGWRRWAAATAFALALLILGNVVDLQRQIDTYRLGSLEYRELSNLRAEDSNYTMGRIAGAVIAPRMIAARPLLGIGWGNYPLVRDDPEYRQGTAFEMGSVDAPSLGVVDYIVELGFPLWLYLTWIELMPVFLLRRAGVDPWVLSLALILPVSTWSGAHLNLIHPWIVVAFALGLGYRRNHPAHPVPAISASQGNLP